MILTITYRGENTTDLGFLLHKNPDRAQKFDLNFGSAYVFYPQASYEITTAALLLDINPIDLARGKPDSREGGLFDYVNDRPYVASSFMSTAINKVFTTAMSGRCDKKPELADKELDLEANITMLPCKGSKELINKIFCPLGYEVSYETFLLDENFMDWGESSYVNLRLSAKKRLCDLLNHLYVLIPVFDVRKHYWITNDEVEKLLKHGEGWLSTHPEKNLIAYRYLKSKKSLVSKAIDKLTEDLNENNEDDVIPEVDKNNLSTQQAIKKPLNDTRLETIAAAVIASGAKRVIDLGCGEGKLISLLLTSSKMQKIAGVDVSVACLERAKDRLKIDYLPEYKKEKLEFMHGSLIYKDSRFSGYDVACVVEVIEHLDLSRLSAFERVLFEFASPPVIFLSTPNAEYNIRYEKLNEGAMRHGDHRFEWTRIQFKEWAEKVCKRFGYTVEYFDIGDLDEQYGAPTQMGVFRKCE